MSFVAGFVTGMQTGGAVERKKGLSYFFQYMQHKGYTIIDRLGRQVPLEKIVKEARLTQKKTWRQILVVGLIGVAAVGAIGGTVWVLVSIV
jgi:hypothetical protein